MPATGRSAERRIDVVCRRGHAVEVAAMGRSYRSRLTRAIPA